LVELAFGWLASQEVMALVMKADPHNKVITQEAYKEYVDHGKGGKIPKWVGVTEEDKKRAHDVLDEHMSYVSADSMLAATESALSDMGTLIPPKTLPPTETDVVIVGAGLTGLTCAAAFKDEARVAKLHLLEKSEAVAGVWTFHGNCFSRVKSQAPATFG